PSSILPPSPHPSLSPLSLHDALPIFLGSAGLRVVLSAAKRLRDVDGQFAVCGLGEHVREVFRVGGFDAIIDIHSDRPTALAKLTDRKSTRLNSSHDQISYAVFCLKKK